ncbi:hypothetical protein [Pseudomonas sp. F8002]|jgi:hypothetical protein|uniref:hypothetical protein n=1 Tax=Pseudomonas sp. F8002 TaxID=2738822 RepID=UPI0015A1C5B8|nr:hypothetical protein [Pseudomonas sp. F8002]NWB55170.1 hypothetical protein [Pseudomonas sp. F8002]
MNAVLNAPEIHAVASEAEFQLICAKQQLEWLGALARAIAMNVEHGKGRDVQVLAGLAKYLDDSGVSSIESAIDHFKEIGVVNPAPRSAQPEYVAREIGGDQ